MSVLVIRRAHTLARPRAQLSRAGRRHAARAHRQRRGGADSAHARRSRGARKGALVPLAGSADSDSPRRSRATGMQGRQSVAGTAVPDDLARQIHFIEHGDILNAVVKDESLAIARELILRPGGLDDARLDGALAQVMSSSVDAADLYFQLSREESWALEDGIVKEGSASIEQGVGVRALSGEKTGFAYSDEIVLPALEEASRAARAIAARGQERSVQSVLPTSGHSLYLPIDPVTSFTSSEKVAWLERVDRETRKMDPRVVQVMASVVAVHEVDAGGEFRRAPGRRRAPAGALQRVGHRRAGRAARAGLRRRGRAHHAARAGRGRQAAGAGARSRAPGAGESRGHSRARRPDDGGARRRLARHPAARGHRPRARGRLQSQGHFGLRGPHRRARRLRALHDCRRRHAERAAAAR